ncbi:5'/3'-nucleotidase SurE [Faunimonas sp. B44]|uniref:5'/3'-nucleotidase SurE n=1 Tax=Faunimonas sp. B44 TaxID=3461493 RepID=UPI004044345A
MKILVTNDDGIHAPGLEVAERIARALSDDVWIVAPEMDQSGVAHALTISDPLRLRRAGERRFAVRGTPTDCVIMGFKVVIGAKPDLVISGVNRGQNLADDVTYSGTVAGAMEGSLLGIPSIALSQAYSYDTIDDPHWRTAETHAPEIIGKLLDGGFGSDTLYNINFPNCAPEAVTGVVVTRQGRRVPDWLKIEKRADGRGHPYYWIAFQRSKMEPEEGTDLHALAKLKISVTPLSLDLTDDRAREKLSGVFS